MSGTPVPPFTVGDVHSLFENYRKTKSGNTIISLKDYSFFEFKTEFIEELKNHIDQRIQLAQVGLDDLTPSDIFVLSVLKDTY